MKFGEKKVAGETYFDVSFPELGWQETRCAGEIFNSSDVELGLFYRTRQGVEHAKNKKPEPNWKRLCSLMSKAKTIREARDIYNKGVGK